MYVYVGKFCAWRALELLLVCFRFMSSPLLDVHCCVVPTNEAFVQACVVMCAMLCHSWCCVPRCATRGAVCHTVPLVVMCATLCHSW